MPTIFGVAKLVHSRNTFWEFKNFPYYGYLSITLPLYGTGFFELDLMTMVIGLTCSSVLAYKIMVRPKIINIQKNTLFPLHAINRHVFNVHLLPTKNLFIREFFWL
ncbi:MAG: hypothetical protein Ct9H300mP4_06850 [Gammaproteobacteria bacterium]|nr:MAG: hypothetical protein Ct9H300mP4_06850 [Gammaproteobacteria bacterium]